MSGGIGAKLKLLHLFGLNGDTRNNVHYVNETEVVYPVGHNVVLYDTEKREQRFIQGSDTSLAIDAIAITGIVSYFIFLLYTHILKISK